jgi:hypothetical protein
MIECSQPQLIVIQRLAFDDVALLVIFKSFQ